MSATTTAPTGELLPDHRVPDRSRAERPTSYAVTDFPVPSGREEEWRFTPIDQISALLADDASAPPARLVPLIVAPDGVVVEQLSDDDPVRTVVPRPQDRAAAIGYRHAAGADRVVVPEGMTVEEPILVTLEGTGGTGSGHLVVDVRPHARATVVVDHRGSATYTQLVSINVQDGAALTLVSIQDWADGAVHLSQHDVVLGRDARARHVAVSLGGDLVRLNVNATYAGPGGDFEALGLYYADAGQHLEHRLFVDHGQPHCRSDVLYKGALQGDGAHTVWIGDVLIRAEAEGTDTYELNRNLILSDGARADSVPNLEIETGQIVGAGHASATGRFDDEQVFYLCSRGIPEDEARRLVVRAFFADLVQRIGVAAVTDRLTEAIEAELARSGA